MLKAAIGPIAVGVVCRYPRSCSRKCKCTCYAFRVPNKPKTPNRVIRVDVDLWRDYGAACETDGVTRSDDLRAYMLRKVKAWKRRQTAEIEEYSGA
jgi:hypothetical protein